MMRRALVGAVLAPALLLAACGGDEPEVQEPTPDDADRTTVAVQDEAEETTAEPDTAEETEESDAAAETEEPPADAAGGEDGAAAAAVAKEFMVALVNADEELCQLIVDLDGEGPMADSPDQLQICEEDLVPTLQGLMSEDEAAIIEMIEIDGAQVEGDTATVNRDNFSDMFAAGFGDDEIVLQRFDDQWYVDLDNSFQG
ncbi:hypothetical protein [Ornithinimicrobium sediminis]|uniref:hypothetical protein n=1 Tax=Ornithinimicrobium sediminis TaxID=2904603 RepID=UPI001E60F18E|nr:hypothetical protein [Ornithinimicrobium sediminis]MCE0485751.1 hypothetical protein [Ornithinimicrobium sediminis]